MNCKNGIDPDSNIKWWGFPLNSLSVRACYWICATLQVFSRIFVHDRLLYSHSDSFTLKVSRAKTEYMCLNGTPLASVDMQSAQLPQVTEFKYLGSTLQSDGGTSAEITKRTQCGWNNWRKMSGVLCDKRVPPHVKGKIHKMIVQPAMLCGMETVPVTSSQVKKLEVTEMKMGMRPHARRPCEK